MQAIAIVDGHVGIASPSKSREAIKLRSIGNLLTLSEFQAEDVRLVENLDAGYLGIAIYNTRAGGPIVLRVPEDLRESGAQFRLVQEDAEGGEGRYLNQWQAVMPPQDIAFHLGSFLKSRGLIKARP